jgi:hypothetical protein
MWDCNYVHHEGSHAQGRHALADGERGRNRGCACFTFTERVEGVGGEKKKPLAARLD